MAGYADRPEGSWASVVSEPPPLPLHERGTALAAIDELIAAAEGGSGGALFLIGDPGLGKSALVDRARATVGGDTRVLLARGTPAERDLAFAYSEQITGALPAPDSTAEALPSDPHERRASFHDLARGQIRSWTEGGPLIVLLDDLHWADPDSIGLIAFLVRRLASLPVAMIATLRPWPPEALGTVQELVADGGVTAHWLAPLRRESSDRLFAELIGREPTPEMAERSWQLSAGNPLLIGEAARAAREDDLPPGGARMRRPLLLSHLAGLSAPAVACAQAAAVVGGRARLGLLEAVAAVPEEEFVAGLDALVQAGVVHVAEDGRIELVHDLVGSAIYEDIAPAHRARLHRRAFDYHVGREDAAQAGPHAMPAGLTGDASAIDILLRAGRLAIAAGAVETGLAHISGAVELGSPEPDDELLLEYGDALFLTGRSARALEVFERLSRRPLGGERRTVALMKLARARAFNGAFGEAMRTYEDLLADGEALGDMALSVVLERAHVVWERDGPGPALESLGRDVAGVGAVDALPGGELLATTEWYFKLQTGDRAGLAALEHMAQTAQTQIAAPEGGDVQSMSVISHVVPIFAMSDRFADALELIEYGCSRTWAAGTPRAAIPLRISRLGILLSQGRLAEVLGEADDIEDELELDHLTGPHVTLCRAQALVALGRTTEAAALCAPLERDSAGHSWYARLNLASVRGQRLLVEGRAIEAVAAYREVEGQVERIGLGEPCTPRWAAGAIEAGFAAGALDDVERLTGWLERHAGGPSRWPDMIAAGGRAGLAAERGNDAGAEQLYLQALAEPCVTPLERAAIALRYGAWLRRCGQATRARPLLAEAGQVADPCGAAPLVAAANAELRAAGGRRRRAAATEGLTVQEERVAHLAATGATVREIAQTLSVSPRTVETHLSHVYVKLGVHSKQELRRRRTELRLGQ
ncbi:MAG TPA: AAA family ATPase [Solirubrobacteraceae bacterium]|nr:AAA family ATPase [Solirubrobacteraceae bacterium]